jgi:ribosome-associated protein
MPDETSAWTSLSAFNPLPAYACRPAMCRRRTFAQDFRKALPRQICCRLWWNPIYFNIISTKRTPIARTSKAAALAIARAMLDKKATDVLILQVAKLTSVADYLVLGSADSDRQTRAIADYVDDVLSDSGPGALSIEGKASSQWVLMDFGDVVVHIFRQDARHHYGLERLWADARRVCIPGYTPPPMAAPKAAVPRTRAHTAKRA